MKRRKRGNNKVLLVIGLALLVVIAMFLIQRPEQKSAQETTTHRIADGETFQLTAQPVRKEISDRNIIAFGYNGEIPGPLLRVRQGSTIYVNFTNLLDQPTTIHWHGLRHNYRFDGVPDISQPPVQPGESFLYELQFPDEGIFWYHPHVREDWQQENGLYGNILVEAEESNWEERFLMIDDILLTDKGQVPFMEPAVNFALMGRFGNVMLVNGQSSYTTTVRQGQTVRWYVTNTANVRPFNISLEQHVFKVMGSDIGGYERPYLANNIVIAPAERYIADITFTTPGTFKLLHTTPSTHYLLGEVTVLPSQEQAKALQPLPLLDLEPYRAYMKNAPDYLFALTINMQGMQMPMMELHDEPIEWEDTMFVMNQMHTNQMMTWVIEDQATGKRNMDIPLTVQKGDIKIIRFENKEDSMHPMQHPIHLHGQRFLVLRQDGKENDNLVWKDTVLIPKGSTVDTLVDFSNPGEWMMHCHIAEHLHAGMMTLFNVRE